MGCRQSKQSRDYGVENDPARTNTAVPWTNPPASPQAQSGHAPSPSRAQETSSARAFFQSPRAHDGPTPRGRRAGPSDAPAHPHTPQRPHHTLGSLDPAHSQFLPTSGDWLKRSSPTPSHGAHAALARLTKRVARRRSKTSGTQRADANTKRTVHKTPKAKRRSKPAGSHSANSRDPNTSPTSVPPATQPRAVPQFHLTTLPSIGEDVDKSKYYISDPCTARSAGDGAYSSRAVLVDGSSSLDTGSNTSSSSSTSPTCSSSSSSLSHSVAGSTSASASASAAGSHTGSSSSSPLSEAVVFASTAPIDAASDSGQEIEAELGLVDLPINVLSRLLGCLDLRTILMCGCVSRSWAAFFDESNHALWMRVSQIHGVPRAVGSSLSFKMACRLHSEPPPLGILLTGLKSAGKTSVFSLLTGTLGDKPLKPTIGVTVRACALPRANTQKPFILNLIDVGGSAFGRKTWARRFSEVHSCVFVVDASNEGTLTQACDILNSDILSHPFMRHKPILVIGTHTDLPGALSANDLYDHLHLAALARTHRVRIFVRVCALPERHNLPNKNEILAEIHSGFHKVVDEIVPRIHKLSLKVERDTAEQDRINAAEAEAKRKKQEEMRKRFRG